MKGHPAVVVVVLVVVFVFVFVCLFFCVFFFVYLCSKSNKLGGSSYLSYMNFLPPRT